MKTAKTYMHAMIFTHISYCYTTWSHTSESTLKPIKTLFKRTLKTLDKNLYTTIIVKLQINTKSWTSIVFSCFWMSV